MAIKDLNEFYKTSEWFEMANEVMALEDSAYANWLMHNIKKMLKAYDKFLTSQK